ncbi:MAG: NAD-binding protein [Thermoplasmata archaeon]|nr:NAD-binding protein [Thermoplasmata archaeon]
MSERSFSKDPFHRLLPTRESAGKAQSDRQKAQQTARSLTAKPISDKMIGRMRIVVMGGGRVGTLLANLLRAEKHQVTLIEFDRERASKLADMLPDALIVNGDGSNINIQRDAGVDVADTFVAVTGSDTLNYVSAQIAKKSLHVPQVIARVNDPSNENNFLRAGIDKLVTTTKATAGEILNEISGGKTVLPLAGVRFEILYALLRDSSPMVGKRVSKCGLPRKAFIISLNREGEPMVPENHTVLKSGDLIAVLTPLEISDKVKAVLVEQ